MGSAACHILPECRTLAPGTFCTSTSEHLVMRRDPHHARTAQHSTHIHARLDDYVSIGPKIMHRRLRTSAQGPEQCISAVQSDPHCAARFLSDQKRVTRAALLRHAHCRASCPHVDVDAESHTCVQAARARSLSGQGMRQAKA